jgi:hypothetical protein
VTMAFSRAAGWASRAGRLVIRVACPNGEANGCLGTLRLRRLGRPLGVRSFALAGGGARTLRFTLPARERALLARGRTVRLIATAAARDRARNAHAVSATLTVLGRGADAAGGDPGFRLLSAVGQAARPPRDSEEEEPP